MTIRFSYSARSALLTPGERRFFVNGLQPAIEDRYLISMKVRLSDVLTVANLRSRAGRKIAQKHLDFVLVTPKRMRIVAAVELNDTSHQQPHRIERDQFVMQSLWTAGIPLIVRSIEQRYDSQEIRRHLNNAIRKAQRGETILNGTNDLP